jgi:hypothetical protein
MSVRPAKHSPSPTKAESPIHNRATTTPQQKSQQHDEPGSQANLPLQRPAKPVAHHHRHPCILPGFRAALQHHNVLAARGQQPSRHPRPLSALADQDNRSLAGQVRQARFNLVHRDVHRAGNMTRPKFRDGSHIHQVRFCLPPALANSATLIVPVIASSLYFGRARLDEKGFRPSPRLGISPNFSVA